METYEVFLYLIGFGSILFLTYVTTRYIANKTNVAMKGKYINIVETISLGVDKKLYLIKVDKQFLLIASSGKKIEFLSEISLDEYGKNENEVKGSNIFDFKSFFEKYVNSYKNKGSEKKEASLQDENVISKGTTASFENNLKKLKSLRKGLSVQDKTDGVDITNEE